MVPRALWHRVQRRGRSTRSVRITTKPSAPQLQNTGIRESATQEKITRHGNLDGRTPWTLLSRVSIWLTRYRPPYNPPRSSGPTFSRLVQYRTGHAHIIKECPPAVQIQPRLRDVQIGRLIGTVKGIRKLTIFIRCSKAFGKKHHHQVDAKRERMRMEEEGLDYFLQQERVDFHSYLHYRQHHPDEKKKEPDDTTQRIRPPEATP